MVKYALAIAVSLVASVASAQPIHGHPQLPAYTTLAQRPVVSFQGHWPTLDPTMTCHLHLDTNDFPYGAELGGALFDVHVTLKLFMCDGRIGDFWGESFVGVVWDATGTATMPVLQGDPMALKQWTATVTIDPKKGRFAHQHGWTGVPFNARIGFANHDVMTVQAITSFYSIIDPTAPDIPPPGGFGPILSTRVDVSSATTGQQFGTMITELDSWIPLLPIAAPWHATLNFYNYTAPAANFLEPTGRFEQRANLNLHAGIRGTLTDSALANKQGVPNRDVVFDPATLPLATNVVAFFWTQTLAAETNASLLVVNVPVQTGSPALCTDPLATNVGQPLPCVFPVPVTWATFPATFQRFGTQDRYRICDAAGHCVELAVKP